MTLIEATNTERLERIRHDLVAVKGLPVEMDFPKTLDSRVIDVMIRAVGDLYFLVETVDALTERAIKAERELDEDNKPCSQLADEVVKYKSERERLVEALGMVYDKWENGTPCSEADDDGNCENGGSIGNAFKLSLTEEQEILNLIVDSPAEHEQACANCGKPYRAHLLHDGNKCDPGSGSSWFPGAIARTLKIVNNDAFNKRMANGDMLGAANSLTIDELIRMMPEIEAKWPKEKMPPNPADVHPATFAALRNVCLPGDVSKLIGIPLDAIVLHVRTDVEPWKLHPCTCKDGGR